MIVSASLLISSVNAALRVVIGADRALAQHARDKTLVLPSAAPLYDLGLTPGEIEGAAEEDDRFRQYLIGQYAIDPLKDGWNQNASVFAQAASAHRAFNDINGPKNKISLLLEETAQQEIEIAQWLTDQNAPVAPLTRFGLVFADAAADFVSLNRDFLLPGSNGGKLVGAFAKQVEILIPNDQNFGTKAGAGSRVLATVFRAGLGTIGQNTDLFSKETHVKELVGALTTPVIDAFGSEFDVSDQVHWETIMDAFVGPAAAAAFGVFAEHQEAFFGEDFSSGKVLGELNKQVLVTLKDLDPKDRFTPEGVLEIYRSVLKLAIKKPDLFVPGDGAERKLVQDLISNFGTVLKNNNLTKENSELGLLFAKAALDALGDNTSALLQLGDTPLEVAAGQVLKTFLDGLQEGLGEEFDLTKLFNKAEVTDLARVLLNLVATHADRLGGQENVQKIVASVAKAMAEDKDLLLDTSAWLDIIEAAMEEAVLNPGRLFGFELANLDAALGSSIIRSFLASAQAALASDWNKENVLFGETLKNAIAITFSIASSDSADALQAFKLQYDDEGMLSNPARELIDEISETVAVVKRDGQLVFGANEWIRLYRRLLLVVFSNIEEGIPKVVPRLLDCDQLSADGEQLIRTILKQKII